jgi:hypothetical protein
MRIVKEVALALALVTALAAAPAPDAHATTMLPQNLVDLVSLSEHIVVGDVIGLSDGFDAQGVPYTEITVRVDETLQGSGGSTLTFRQFGLLEPRTLPDGSRYLGVTPPGWPEFRVDEEVMLFVHEGSRATGLRTTVGLLQGKFTIRDGRISNGVANRNVFHHVDLDTSLLSARQAKAVQDPATMEAEAFIDLVRAAVKERWVEEGRLSHAQH